MKKQQFFNEVRTQMRAYVEDDVELKLERVVKNNDQLLTALIVRQRGVDVAQMIYLDPYYERYQNGISLETIIEQISQSCDQGIEETPWELELNYSFEQCQNRLFFRLVNRELNQTLWENTPYVPWQDLALTVRWLVQESDQSLGSILVTQRELETWGVTWEEVVYAAWDNTREQFPEKIIKLSSLLYGIAGKQEQKSQLYVLTNTKELNGATAVCYPNVLHDLSMELDQNLYILPSSIHECLLLPDNGTYELEYLKNMVADVNHAVVSEDEILSYEVYYYDKVTKQISIVTNEIECEKDLEER